ncbi:hypothetical protein [Haloglycomyces albus]|uniref:hypothetical protein n=1 Tax=Haloglycomyces albus TaxID=526067 RepID=UPI00046D1836|nr:hypothetical protein [Haloglycomyces albus]
MSFVRMLVTGTTDPLTYRRTTNSDTLINKLGADDYDKSKISFIGNGTWLRVPSIVDTIDGDVWARLAVSDETATTIYDVLTTSKIAFETFRTRVQLTATGFEVYQIRTVPNISPFPDWRSLLISDVYAVAMPRSAAVRLSITAEADTEVAVRYSGTYRHQPNYMRQPISVTAGVTAVIDYVPPLDATGLCYEVAETNSDTWVASNTITGPTSDGALIMRGHQSPLTPARAHLTGPPEISYDTESEYFWPASPRAQGRAFAAWTPRRAATLATHLYTHTSRDSLLVRSLIRKNPICVQFPGILSDTVTNGWYGLGSVNEIIFDVTTGARDWRTELTPVYAPLGIFESTEITWGDLHGLTGTYRDAAALRLTLEGSVVWALETIINDQ